ncbi:structural maintenance of chromosomes protein 1 [Tanacetum coccineum]
MQNLHQYNQLSWSVYDIHILLMDNGLAIHMLTEKKYPLSQEMLTKMLSRKLEVDHESSQAFELLRFIRSQNNALAKLSMLKLGEYEIWEIRIKQYFQIQDYALWEVIENGNSWVPIPVTTPESGLSTTLKMIVPSTTEEKICKKNDVKARRAAEENSTLARPRKMTIVMEREQKNQQKEEAEKHMRLQEELQPELLKLEEEKTHIKVKLKNTSKELERRKEEKTIHMVEIEKQLESRKQELESQQKQMQSRFKKIVEATRKHHEELKRLRKEQSDVRKKLGDPSKEKYEMLKTKISELENQLHELKADEHKNDRDANLSRAVEDLRRLFRGVHGRMTEPGQLRRNVTVAMGRFMDVVVVENDHT